MRVFRLVVFVVATIGCTAATNRSGALAQDTAPAPGATSVRGSSTLCDVIAPYVVSADAALAPAARAAVDAGTNDTDVLYGTRARHGSAYVAVEEDAKTISTIVPAGLDTVTNGQIALAQLSLPNETVFASNSLGAYENGLKAVREFGRLALLYERTVNAKNRSAHRAALSRAFAAFGSAMGSYSTSYTNLNVNCVGANCYGNATTTTRTNGGSENPPGAANASRAAVARDYTLTQVTPAVIAMTQKIADFRYDYRRLRAVWVSACPDLKWPDPWAPVHPAG